MIDPSEWMFFVLSRAGQVRDEDMEEAYREWQAGGIDESRR